MTTPRNPPCPTTRPASRERPEVTGDSNEWVKGAIDFIHARGRYATFPAYTDPVDVDGADPEED